MKRYRFVVYPGTWRDPATMETTWHELEDAPKPGQLIELPEYLGKWRVIGPHTSRNRVEPEPDAFAVERP